MKKPNKPTTKPIRHGSNLPGFGAKLRAIRLANHLSQSTLAESVGVTPSNITQLESDLISPTFSMVIRLVGHLGCKFEDLIPDSDS